MYIKDTLIEETVFYLEELGLTQYEAKVYIALLFDHPASAYAISRRSGVPHSRVYEVARRLIRKGLVIMADKKPERFSPLAPMEFVEKLSREHERVVDELKLRLNEMVFHSDFDPVWNIANGDEAIKKAREIIKDAKNRIFIGIWDEELTHIMDDLREAYVRGVEAVFLIYGKEVIEFGKCFYHSTEAMEDISELGRSIDIVADSEIAISGRLGSAPENLLSNSNKNNGRYFPCQVVWTRNQGLINAIEGYIIHDFYIAELIQALGGEIEEVFGKNMKELREKYRTQNPYLVSK
jgi:sugar-specific transcriptional regulator TrmB